MRRVQVINAKYTLGYKVFVTREESFNADMLNSRRCPVKS
jgi:hypothetical protein